MTSKERIDLAADLILERRRVTRFRNRRALLILAGFVTGLTLLIGAVVIEHHLGTNFLGGALNGAAGSVETVGDTIRDIPKH